MNTLHEGYATLLSLIDARVILALPTAEERQKNPIVSIHVWIQSAQLLTYIITHLDKSTSYVTYSGSFAVEWSPTEYEDESV